MNYNNEPFVRQDPTERQISFIKDLARRAGEIVDVTALQDRRAASSLIDRLKRSLEERRARAKQPLVVEEWVDRSL